uniref:Uncharacterized protein n=1 Tax=Anguilla anguilla TaxID=7936 RepID=A0A0E9QQM3_ANGAN
MTHKFKFLNQVVFLGFFSNLS